MGAQDPRALRLGEIARVFHYIQKLLFVQWLFTCKTCYT